MSIAGFPYFEVQFDKGGNAHDPAESKAVLDFVAEGAGSVTDLFVISHGWNNDMADARDLYKRLLERLRSEITADRVPGIAGRKLGVLAVLWPSKKFAEKDLIASGAASTGGVVSTQTLREEIGRIADAFDPEEQADLDKAKELAAKLDDSPSARNEFVARLRSALGAEGGAGEDGEGADEETPGAFFSLPGDEMLKRLSKPLPKPKPGSSPQSGGSGSATSVGSTAAASSAGGAASLGAVSGIKGGAFKLLNLTTYYKMKNRAGKVGLTGLHPLLRQIRAKRPDLKLHLIGHSFGGRLVAAAALGPGGQAPVKLSTLTLLQAAFSHYGFAENYDAGQDGFFRKVVSEGRIAGPIVITATHNDKAVGVAYPLASQLAGQVAAGIGDKDSKYGGLGANGAQKSGAVEGKLLAPGGAYAFQGGKIYNLNADAVITGHSDICKDEVTHAVLTAVAGT